MVIHKDMFKQPTSEKEKEKIKTLFGDTPTNWNEGPLKEVMLEYVGKLNETEDVTTEMIVHTLAEEFPEFLMAVAEENWIRGYQQAIHDVDEGQKLLQEHNEQNTDGNS
tara:strand:- start:55 stop:381 length:327 start_codon:yes stop_codon:yes gene_type:complete